MALYDVLFTDGEIQNFLVELDAGTSHSFSDFLTNSNTGYDLVCLETPLIVPPTPPDTVILSDGKLAKRISDTFYLKL